MTTIEIPEEVAQFELPDAEEGGGCTRCNGSRFVYHAVRLYSYDARGVPGTRDGFAVGDKEAECPGGRHTQRCHRFRCQKLADTGSQYRTSVATAAIRGRASSLELELPALAAMKKYLEHGNGSPVPVTRQSLTQNS